MVLSFGSDQLGVGGLLLSQLCFIPSFALLAIAESLVEAISSQLAPRLLWPYRVSRPRLPLLYLQHLSDMIHCGNRPHDSHNATYISCCLMRQQKKKKTKSTCIPVATSTKLRRHCISSEHPTPQTPPQKKFPGDEARRSQSRISRHFDMIPYD